MAGNIIPAIATTNAIVAGLVVFQGIRVLKALPNSSFRPANVCARRNTPLMTISSGKPSPSCGVCRDTYVIFPCDPSKITLGDLLQKLVKSSETGLGYGESAKISVYEGGRLLNEPDYGDDDEDRLNNESKTLEALGVTIGKWLTITDEEDEGDKHDNVVFSISSLYVVFVNNNILQG